MTKLKCKKCGDIIEGDKKGTYIECSCKAIAIDETEYYFRINGNVEDFLIEDSNGEWKEIALYQKEDKKNDK